MTSYLHWVFVWGIRRENDITTLLTSYICLRNWTIFSAKISYTICVALVLFIFLVVDCLHQIWTQAYLISLNSTKGPQQRLWKIIFNAMWTPQWTGLLPEDLEITPGGTSKQTDCTKDACSWLSANLGLGLQVSLVLLCCYWLPLFREERLPIWAILAKRYLQYLSVLSKVVQINFTLF